MALLTPKAFDFIHELKEAEICNEALSSIGAELIVDTTENTKQARICREVYGPSRNELLRYHPFNFATKIARIPFDSDYPHPTDARTYTYKKNDYKSFSGTADTVSVISVISGIDIDETLIGRAVEGSFVRENTRIIAVDTVAETITLDRATTGAASFFTVYLPVLKVIEVNTDENTIFEVVGSGERSRIITDSATDWDDDEPVLEMKYTEKVIDPELFDTMFRGALVAYIASKIAFDLTKDRQVEAAAQGRFSSLFNAAKLADLQEFTPIAADDKWTDRS